MKPAPFDYVIPATLEEAIGYLANDDVEAHVLAGGQSLVPAMNMRMSRPELLVDLAKVDDLDFIRDESGSLQLGAMTTKRDVEMSPVVAHAQPLLHAANMWVAHPQIRNRSTVGGSIAHADPAAEYPAVALLLGAEFEAQGPNGKRTIPVDDFFVTYFTTALEEGEVLTKVMLPAMAAGTGWSFQEIARRHGDFAMAGVGVTLQLDSAGHCQNTRVVPFALGPTPVRATAVEEAINGETPSADLFEHACQKMADGIEDPTSDVHASVEYRRHLSSVLGARALEEAVDRARAAN
ncbi:MAG: xanthine dehydrogenase family protein subunit M [Myxococcota bacterium]|jgi:carbon-monoxide dehydrogenase medium subunit|nr:xanthine dehydrogenase family protein subunit M [Myxococcota bacterium]